MAENESQTVYLSLGSNLGDRERNLRAAVDRLGGWLDVLAVSRIYETAAVGVTDQPPFLNLAVSAHTDLDPRTVLLRVKEVERVVGRTPTFRWGPRVVDIDIVMYGDLVLDSPGLSIPHKEMRGRAFVLVPLAEIAPAAKDPVTEMTVLHMAARLDSADVSLWEG